MTITTRIHEQLFAAASAPADAPEGSVNRLLVRMPLTHPRRPRHDQNPTTKPRRRRSRAKANSPHLALAWTDSEHERFLRGLELFPRGPWKDVAHYVGTRTVRQTMTHAQKYREKIARHKRMKQAETVGEPAALCPSMEPGDGISSTAGMLAPVANAVSLVETDPVASLIGFAQPIADSTGPQSIYSPLPVEELALGLPASVAESVTWRAAAQVPTASISVADPAARASLPLALQPIEGLAISGALPSRDCGGGELDLLLEDSELDSVVIDDFVHSFFTQHPASCPTDDMDSWSFVHL